MILNCREDCRGYPSSTNLYTAPPPNPALARAHIHTHTQTHPRTHMHIHKHTHTHTTTSPVKSSEPATRANPLPPVTSAQSRQRQGRTPNPVPTPAVPKAGARRALGRACSMSYPLRSVSRRVISSCACRKSSSSFGRFRFSYSVQDPPPTAFKFETSLKISSENLHYKNIIVHL